jgi:hypothetical protein
VFAPIIPTQFLVFCELAVMMEGSLSLYEKSDRKIKVAKAKSAIATISAEYEVSLPLFFSAFAVIL